MIEQKLFINSGKCLIILISNKNKTIIDYESLEMGFL